LRRALLKDWVRENDLVTANERTGVQVDGCMIVEVNCDFGEFVLLRGRTDDVSIDQSLKLLRPQRRVELERRAQKGLGDGEGGNSISHCDGLRGGMAALSGSISRKEGVGLVSEREREES